VRLVTEAGAGNALTLLALVLATVISAIGYPVFLAGVAYAFVFDGFWPSSGTADIFFKAMSVVLFAAGTFSMVLPAALGAHRRNLRKLWLIVPLLPVYYLLVSAAAWRALYELAASPFHWNKTDHGLARSSHYGISSSGVQRSRALD
jgi:glycosyltransferase XagB